MIRNYEYGLLPPTENAALVLDQMRLAHRYRNKLVELERDRRTGVAAILVGHPDASAIAAEVEQLARDREEARAEILRARAASRSRSETAVMRERVAEVSKHLRDARARLRDARALVRGNPEIVDRITELEDRFRERVRSARAACDVYWGTYLLQEQAADAARKSPTPPRFTRFDGEGRVSVQLQGGLDLDGLWGTDTQVQIDPVPAETHSEGTRRGDRRRLSRTTLRLRVQSTDKGRPVWASWPMILHRPIPPGARVKIATVSRRRRDCRTWDWRLLLTLDIPDGAISRVFPAGGAVALNLGWHQGDDVVRAGYVVSDDGGIDHEIVVERSTIDRVEKSASIRSIRDKNLDAMRAALVAWMREHEASLPTWLVERTILSRPQRPRGEPGQGQLGADAVETSTTSSEGSPSPHEAGPPPAERDGSPPPHEAGRDVPPDQERRRIWHVLHWRSAQRFRELAFAWRRQRFDDDAAGYDLIEAWRYRDEHLERYESGMRRGALLDRRERYRILAADLATRYRTLVIDDFDLRTFQESPAPEDERVELPAVKRNQRHAAGSELRASLLNAFGPERVVKLSSKNVTRACHACRGICAVTTVDHACEHCGARWDRDANACRNLLRTLREQSDADAAGGTAREGNPAEKKESRSDRLRRGRKKRAEVDAARDPA